MHDLAICYRRPESSLVPLLSVIPPQWRFLIYHSRSAPFLGVWLYNSSQQAFAGDCDAASWARASIWALVARVQSHGISWLWRGGFVDLARFAAMFIRC